MAISREELENYLRKRREIYGYRERIKKIRPKDKEEKKTDEKREQVPKLSILDKIRGLIKPKVRKLEISPEIKDADEMIEEIENMAVSSDEFRKERVAKKCFFSQIRKLFVRKQDMIEIPEKKTLDLDYEEIRQAFRIANSLIKKLPPAVLKAFKESDSYKIYYNTMKKLDLVKKSEDEIHQ
ncbi:MAG: hypothetical protein QXD62_03630 [Candidatus Woesearchaeota archaeon]